MMVSTEVWSHQGRGGLLTVQGGQCLFQKPRVQVTVVTREIIEARFLVVGGWRVVGVRLCD